MKTLVIYYSYSGQTRKLAEAMTQELGADICEVRDKKRRGMFGTLFLGCAAAIRGKATPIEPITADLASYDRLVILAPVWAGNPAPAINNVFDALPAGKQVEVHLVSSGGHTECEGKLRARIGQRGSELAAFADHKSVSELAAFADHKSVSEEA